MHNIILKNKKYLMFIIIIVLIGLFSGFLYYHFLSSDIQININNTLKEYSVFNANFIIKHLIIMSMLLVLSFLFIGLPLSIFYLFYESLSIGFLINIFYVSYGLSGLLYSLIYIVINKLIVLALMILYIQKLINIGRYIIGIIIYKKDSILKDKIIINFKNSLYIIILVLIINIIIYFVSPLLFKYLSFLLK